MSIGRCSLVCLRRRLPFQSLGLTASWLSLCWVWVPPSFGLEPVRLCWKVPTQQRPWEEQLPSSIWQRRPLCSWPAYLMLSSQPSVASPRQLSASSASSAPLDSLVAHSRRPYCHHILLFGLVRFRRTGSGTTPRTCRSRSCWSRLLCGICSTESLVSLQ